MDERRDSHSDYSADPRVVRDSADPRVMQFKSDKQTKGRAMQTKGCPVQCRPKGRAVLIC